MNGLKYKTNKKVKHYIYMVYTQKKLLMFN